MKDGPQDIQELTAYLDGELDQAARDRVEARLGSDREYLAQMQQLQQTWDLLDQIPESVPAKSFTEKTMELAIGDEVKRRNTVSAGVWVLRSAVMLAIPLALFAVSYAIARHKQNQPDRILLENLSVIDHHPYYTIARNDNQFVDGLLELFSGNSALVTSNFTLGNQIEPEVLAITPETPDARKSYVTSLSAEEKIRLKKQMTEFLKKPQAKQDALKAFDREVRSCDDASERLFVLGQYYEWLRSLKQEQRTVVMGLPAQECLVHIEQIRNIQASDKLSIAGLSEVPPHDIELIFGWYDAVCWEARGSMRYRFAQTVSKLASAQGRKPSRGALRIAERGFFPRLVKVLLQLDRQFVEQTVLREHNLELLDLMLSEEAREVLYSRDSDQQKRLVLQWFESANQAKFDVRPEDLYKFEKTLDSQTKSQLRSQNLSSEGYIAAIRKLYREKHEPAQTRSNDQEWDELLEQLQGQRSQ